jgi:hypothetical protein
LNKIKFDYTGSLSTRDEQIQTAKDFWMIEILSREKPNSQPDLLIDDKGIPIETKAKYFESKRNNQPITLQE